MGRALPHFICGEATLYTYLQAKVGPDVPLYIIFAPGPSRASSPPGAHVSGESSQLSLAYRHLSPKIKE